MASVHRAKSTGNGAPRSQGRSLLLVCVMAINVFVVAVAPMMRSHPATAQDLGAAVTEESEQSKEPATQTADVTTPPVPAHTPAAASAASEDSVLTRLWNGLAAGATKVDNMPREADNTDPASQSDQSDVQNHAGSPPSVPADNGSPTENGHELATNDRDADPEKDATVAQSDASSERLHQDSPSDADPELAPPATATLETLVIVNPEETGGVVYYLADGKVRSLAPGESHSLGEGRDRTIEFHRGGDFGETQFVLRSGTYYFRVEDTGWDLAESRVE